MKKISVLIADDHAVVRDGLRALLEQHPDIAVVGDAADGFQAIEQVGSLHPDVVIMDISMPKFDGIDAIQQIQVSAPTTRAIVLSMLGTPEHLYRALRAGVRGYLLKESAGREVVAAVLAVHAGNVYFSQPITNTMITEYLHYRDQAETKDDPLQCLSEREREILYLVVEGKTSAEIAGILFLSPKTVESYRSRMMHKLGTPDLPSLLRFAAQRGLLS